jgi:type VI secretion system secreted protein VgrG
VSSSAVTFTGDSITGDFTFQIVGDSLTGLTFDELQFSAKAYDSPTAAYLTTAFKDDSSDYLVRNIQYQGITVVPTSPSLFEFQQANYTVAEGGVATINVIRTGNTAAASINYATLDGSASSAGTAADYTSAAGLLNFAAGQTTASFTVTALTDSILESAETVSLVLLGGNVGSNPSFLTINDVVSTTVAPTPTPTSTSLFQFAQPNYTVAEGGAATINVTRTGGTEAASINYQTLDGSASSAGTAPDYTSAAGVLNFAAGQTTASFTVPALTDAILESAETVNLVLFGGNVSSPSILTINDVVSTTVAPTPTPTSTSLFQFAQPNYTVAEGGVATINVTRTGGTEAASINYQTLDGSASSAGSAPDYTSAAGLLNFAAGQTTASFTVPALTDAILESAETVNLVLFGGNVGSTPSILTINDVVSTTVAPTPTATSTSLFQFAQPNYTVAEGGVATINVTRTGGTEAASINYQTLDGSASSAGTAADYNSAAGVLNFAAGQTTASFTVPALTDSILESPETVNLVLLGGNVGSTPSILTINDVVSTTVAPTPTPTSPSLFQFAQPNYTVAEGGAATINVTRTGGTEAASINYQTLDGSASSAGTAADYTSAAGVLNFAAGQTTASFTVPALTDSILESAETVNLVLLGGNVGSTPSILTINDVRQLGRQLRRRLQLQQHQQQPSLFLVRLLSPLRNHLALLR